MKMPEQAPPGSSEVYRLRLTVRDEAADTLLARLSDPETRQGLPGFLYVYSHKYYDHQPNDYLDGFSATELVFSSYKRRINDFNRTLFHGREEVGLRERILNLRVGLGHEAAKRVFARPLFDEMPEEPVLDVYYPVPGRRPIDADAVAEVEEYMNRRPYGIYDELTLVNALTAKRPIFLRSRERKDDILQT